MVLRFFFRYLANNEQLINRMADSYVMRRAAQLIVAVMYKAKHAAENRGLHEMTPERFRSIVHMFKNNLKQEIEGAKEQLKRRKD